MKGCSAAALLASCLMLQGCFWGPEKPPFEYLPDMRHAVPYEAFAPNPNFADGKTLQRRAEGTIPRGFLPFLYGPGPEEAARAGRELEAPLQPSPEVLARGRELYGTFCAVCHGPEGAGDGPLIPKYPPPPAYTSSRVRELPPGHLYHVVTYGSGRMRGYRAQILPQDRWRLVLWIDTLIHGEDPS